jgi:integrase
MAGRIPRPWYRKEKGGWYVCLEGRQVNLGKDKDEAFRKFHRLMAGDKESPGVQKPNGPTVAELAEHYLADMGRRVAVRTAYVARCYLQPFLARCGRLHANALKKYHIEEVIREHGRWNATTENHVKSRIVALFSWCVEQGLTEENPVKGIRKPRAKSRGSQSLIDADELEKLMAAAPPYLRNVLFALFQTGARPCEVLTVEAKDFDPERGLWVLQDHKTRESTGRPRIIYLSPPMVELCKELATKNQTGPLFRRKSGKPFPPSYYLARLVRQLRRRLGMRESVTPYGLRHTFATDALANGVPDAQVAELLGHSGTAMLHKHYSHLTARSQLLQAALGRVRP